MGYFESLKSYQYNEYLVKNPRKADVLNNARIKGNTFILGGSNNRALIISTADAVYLQSYDTLILKYDRTTGDLEKLWNDYSVTTLKHINMFMQSINGKTFNKASWLAFKGGAVA